MSVNKRRGSAAEQAVCDYMTHWTSYDGWEPPRMTSKGSKDEGDVWLPSVSVEVKSSINLPALSSLLDNATWKGANGGKAVWLLVVKPPGLGYASVRNFWAATTLKGFCESFSPVVPGMNPELAGNTDSVVEYIAERVMASSEPTDFWQEMVISKEVAPRKFRYDAVMRTYGGKLNGFKALDQLEADFKEDFPDVDYEGTITENRVTRWICWPRAGRSSDDWYVMARFSDACRVLEGIGSLPQDPSEYLLSDPI